MCTYIETHVHGFWVFQFKCVQAHSFCMHTHPIHTNTHTHSHKHTHTHAKGYNTCLPLAPLDLAVALRRESAARATRCSTVANILIALTRGVRAIAFEFGARTCLTCLHRPYTCVCARVHSLSALSLGRRVRNAQLVDHPVDRAFAAERQDFFVNADGMPPTVKVSPQGFFYGQPANAMLVQGQLALDCTRMYQSVFCTFVL